MIFIEPSKATMDINETLRLGVYLDSESENINAAVVRVRIPPLLELIDVDRGGSIFRYWVEVPQPGAEQVVLTGGLPSPGYAGSRGFITSFTVKAKRAGTAVIVTDPTSKAYIDDGLGTEAYVKRGNAVIVIGRPPARLPPLAPPVVQSPTHLREEKWYAAKDAIFTWQGVPDASYSYIINDDPFEFPDTISETKNTSTIIKNLPDGVWYLHVRQCRLSVCSVPARFRTSVDSQPPQPFYLEVVRTPEIYDGLATLIFNSVDLTSGVDYFDVIENERVVRVTSSPYLLKSQNPGLHKIIVRAIDKAKNFREQSVAFYIPPVESPLVLLLKKPLIQGVIIGVSVFLFLLLLTFALLSTRKMTKKMDEKLMDANFIKDKGG